MNHPIYKMQQDFLRRHEHAMADELSKMLEGEELLSMQERTAVAATLRFDNNGEHQARILAYNTGLPIALKSC